MQKSHPDQTMAEVTLIVFPVLSVGDEFTFYDIFAPKSGGVSVVVLSIKGTYSKEYL